MAMHPQEIPEVDALEARALSDSGAVLLDVREDDEWAAGHAPGACHVPLGALPSALDQLSKDGRIVAVCRVGGRSAQATAALRHWGYDAVNLAGGMQAWAGHDLDVVTDDGRPGQVI